MEPLQCAICPEATDAPKPISVTDVILIVTTAANIFLTLFQIGVDYHYKTARGKPYIAKKDSGSLSPRGGKRPEKFAASV